MKTLQEKLDESAKALEPILWELLDEIEDKQMMVLMIAFLVFGFLYSQSNL